MKCLKFSLPLTTLVNRSILVFAMLLGGGACAEPSQSNHSVSGSFGTYERPFSARSYWNIRPVGARLGYFQIPDSRYNPLIGEGPYSSAAFLARNSDAPMKVYGRDAKKDFGNLMVNNLFPASPLRIGLPAPCLQVAVTDMPTLLIQARVSFILFSI